VNPAGTRVYVTNFQSANVSVIDTASNTVVATVPVGLMPRGVAVNPAGTKVYVANRDSFNISVIETATNVVVANVAVGPIRLASPSIRWHARLCGQPGLRFRLSGQCFGNRHRQKHHGRQRGSGSISARRRGESAGTRAYVVNGGGNVSVIDTATNTVVATVAVGGDPAAFGLFIGPSFPHPRWRPPAPVRDRNPSSLPSGGGTVTLAGVALMVARRTLSIGLAGSLTGEFHPSARYLERHSDHGIHLRCSKSGGK